MSRRGFAPLLIAVLVAIGTFAATVGTQKVLAGKGPPSPQAVSLITGVGTALDSVLASTGLGMTGMGSLLAGAIVGWWRSSTQSNTNADALAEVHTVLQNNPTLATAVSARTRQLAMHAASRGAHKMNWLPRVSFKRAA